MLTDYEKACLANFLQTLDDSCLKRLSSSVTNGRLTGTSREDAISCILLHSESLISFFNRKRVSTSVLLHYLHTMQIPVAGEAPKEIMLEQIFNLWKVPYQPVSSHNHHYVTPSSALALPVPPQPMGTNTTQSLQLANPQSGADNPYTALRQMIDHKKILQEADAVALEDFVYSFAAQYFELLNKPDPSTCYLHSLNSTHIFSKCRIKIVVKKSDEDIEVVDDNCESALKHLSELRESYRVLFCPNLSAGNVQNKKSCDGLLYVGVYGTLHHPDRVWGSFKQSFVLSADPFSQNSYKVKDSELILINNKDLTNGQQMLMQSSEKVNQRAIESSSNVNQLAIESSSNVEIIDVS